MVACLAVGEVEQVFAVLLLDAQSFGQVDVGLQGGEGGSVVELDFDRLGLAGGDAEVVDVEPVRLIGLGLLTPFYNGNVANKNYWKLLSLNMQISSKFLKRTRI
ncbi:MAG: hypothetical protein J6I72_10485 [Muribaculaceae bacterium]|nr:hypothetical protein [Muribaculaceae bacterium]